MLDRLPIAPRSEVGILQQVGHGIDRARNDPRALSGLPDLHHAAVHEPADEYPFERLRVLGPQDLHRVSEARVLLQLRHPHHVVDVREPRRRDVDVDVAVLAWPHRRHRDLALAVDVSRVLISNEHRRPPVRAPRLRLHDRYVHVVAAASDLAAKQGRDRGAGGLGAGEELDHVAPQLHGVAAGSAAAVIRPSQGIVDDLRPTEVPVRPRLAEIGDRGHDQTGVVSLQDLIREAQRGQDRGAKVLHQNVGGGGKAQDHVAALRRLQVHGHAALVRVEVEEQGAAFRVRLIVRERPSPTGQVSTPRPFDLNDVGPVVRQEFGAVRPRDVLGQVNDAKAAEGGFDHARSVPESMAGRLRRRAARPRLPRA